MKTKLIALPIALAIAFTPVAASAQVCGLGIIDAAMVANAQQHRELTEKEAATCGLMLNQDQKGVEKARAKKVSNKKKVQN
jgi:Skp family chaperone for outer membrane proteins